MGVAKLGWRCMRGGFGAGSVAACRRFQPLSERASCPEVIRACCEGFGGACMLSQYVWAQMGTLGSAPNRRGGVVNLVVPHFRGQEPSVQYCIATGGCLYFHTLSYVRPSPLPTAASRKAAERPRAVSRVELSVVESRSNSFRRSPEHLWPCRPCRRRQGQTCTHDSRDDLLQRRAGRATRSTTPSNSTSELFR